MPKADTVERIMELIRLGDDAVIDMIYGPPLTMASKCLRSFFTVPPGKKLISGDWSNIEGRGQAWFAGEDWKLRAFVEADAGRGPGIYELAYSRMFNVPVESVKDPSEERQVGKVSELAFGYQGGVGSFHTMGKNYGVKVEDEKANEFKEAWRNAHPKIAGTLAVSQSSGRSYRKGGVWKEIETAAINAVMHPGEAYQCGHPSRPAKYRMAGSFLWCLLPSGRAICYPYPKILEGAYGPMLTYMTVPSQDDKKKSKIIEDAKNASNWSRVGTYGGSLFNNIVQGFSRDFLADCMLRLDAAGAEIVLHTHDDINIEVEDAKTEGARLAMRAMMLGRPAWAAGFPLKAKPQIMQRYGK
jgi:DNA polymerase